MKNKRIESHGATISRLKSRIEDLEKNHELNKAMLLKIQSALADESRKYNYLKITNMKQIIDSLIAKFDIPI